MKHSIRFPDGTLQVLDCNFGSGVMDKNGVEIFEGDLIRSDDKDSTIWKVIWNDGGFELYYKQAGDAYFCQNPLYDMVNDNVFDQRFEVVKNK